MKRKVIQIAESTQLISLPRQWAKQYNIKKGDELEVEERNNTIIVSTEKEHTIEKADLNISDLAPMILRSFVALYKKGVDEIRISFDNVSATEDIHKAIGKEAVGFEIIEQGRDYCIVRHVSGELEDFEPLLRRTFLLLISMSNETLETIKKKDYGVLTNVALLEETNNRFTTSCRRYLNKKGLQDNRKLGPMYYIIEDLENIADEYKYICRYLYSKKDQCPTIGQEVIFLFTEVNILLRKFYELYYKFDKKTLADIGAKRKEIIKKAIAVIEEGKDPASRVIASNIIVIAQKIFNLTGPYLVMTIGESAQGKK